LVFGFPPLERGGNETAFNPFLVSERRASVFTAFAVSISSPCAEATGEARQILFSVQPS
jgi:hypothetical protein